MRRIRRRKDDDRLMVLDGEVDVGKGWVVRLKWEERSTDMSRRTLGQDAGEGMDEDWRREDMGRVPGSLLGAWRWMDAGGAMEVGVARALQTTE